MVLVVVLLVIVKLRVIGKKKAENHRISGISDYSIEMKLWGSEWMLFCKSDRSNFVYALGEIARRAFFFFNFLSWLNGSSLLK